MKTNPLYSTVQNNESSPSEPHLKSPLIQEYGIDIQSKSDLKAVYGNDKPANGPKKRQSPIAWKPEEDEKLSKLVEIIGHKWIQLIKYFPDKTELQIKNRWYSNIRRNQRKMKNRNKEPKPIRSRKSRSLTSYEHVKPIDPDQFWERHLNREEFIKECMEVFYEISI